MLEIWETIEEFPDYKVSNKGRIMNTRNHNLIKPFDDGRGYNSIHLYKDKKRYTRKVHRLVAEAFVEGKCEGYEVNHIDGFKKNNFAYNLEWCTKSENIKHAYYIGLIGKGESKYGD